MDPVRPIGAPRPTRPTRRAAWPVPTVALAVVLAVLLGTFRTPGIDNDADLPVPEPAASADVALVRALLADLAAGDVESAAAMVAPRPDPVVLPGLPFGFMPQRPSADEVAEGLGFFAAVMDVATTDCRLDGRSLGSEAAVQCTVSVSSSFAGAGRVEGRAIPVVFSVRDDRVTGILSGYTGAPALERYCYWVEQNVRVVAVQLFDTDCVPVADAAAARHHRRLAAEFAASGRPRAGTPYLSSRSGVVVADILVAAHNRSGNSSALVFDEAVVAAMPGMMAAGRTAPLAEYLGWSEVVHRVDPGTCHVDGRDAPGVYRVVCPEATWSGPLVEGLGLDPLRQPLEIDVRGAAVSGMSGPTVPALLRAYEDFCAWVYAAKPYSVATLFSDGCRPIYTPQAARGLLVVLSGYTEGVR